MVSDRVHIHARPNLTDSRMILSFSGWMDGGDVSTGTGAVLISKLQAQKLAERIQKLEEDYDNEVFDTQMTDLKDWLEQQGIRLD